MQSASNTPSTTKIGWLPSDPPFVPFEGARGPIAAVACIADGTVFLQGGGKVHWVRDGGVARSIVGYGGVACADGAHLLIGGTTTALRLVRITDGGDVRWFRDARGAIEDLALSRDGTRAASATFEGARIWDVAAPNFSPPIRTIAAHTRGVQKLALDPSARLLATRSFEELSVWDLATGARVAELPSIGGRHVRPCFSVDGSLLAASSSDHVRATLFRVGPWTVERTFECGAEPTALAFSPDGRLLACACGLYDSKILLFDLTGDVAPTMLLGPVAKVHAVAFSPDGATLFAASDRLHVWNRGAAGSKPVSATAPVSFVDVPRTRPNARPLEIPGTVDGVERWLVGLPWLASLGAPSRWDAGAARVDGFDRWPGPEDERVEELGRQTMAWLNEVNAAVKTHGLAAVMSLYERVRLAVISIAGARVGYDPDEDPWNGPWACVQDSAHTAGLVAAFVALGWELPQDLEERLAWFSRGHWPMAYVEPTDADDVGAVLLVY